jgi:hypothetical protein
MALSVRKWRDVLVLVVTAIAFAVSFVMLRQAIGPDSPWLGLVSMFYVLGIAKIAEPLFMLRMPRPLRDLRAWERSGTVYRVLGAKGFGRLLRATPLHFLNASLYLARQPAKLQHVLRLVESAEAAHFWAALLFFPWIGITLANGQYLAGTVFVLVQVFFNLYPILHLRLVRDRLSRHAIAASRKRRAPAVSGVAA